MKVASNNRGSGVRSVTIALLTRGAGFYLPLCNQALKLNSQEHETHLCKMSTSVHKWEIHLAVGALHCGCITLWVHHMVSASHCGCITLWWHHMVSASHCGCITLRVHHTVGASRRGCITLWVHYTVGASHHGCITPWVHHTTSSATLFPSLSQN